MKRTRLVIFSLLVFVLGAFAFMGFRQIPAKAAGDSVGVIADGEAPAWILGQVDLVKEKFQAAYDAAGFTAEPTETVKSVDLDKARVILYQDIPGEGRLYLNDLDSDVLTVTDLEAVAELDRILEREGVTKKGILLNTFEKDGTTFYVTDAWEDASIFQIVEDAETPGTFVAEYYDFKIGIGECTFGDIQWMEFTKAYQLALGQEIDIGLPLEESKLGYYVTPDVEGNGKLKIDGGEVVTSRKQYISQKFEKGYIMHASMRKLDAEGNMIWTGHLPTQQPAAVILADMYEKVMAIEGNAEFNVTGMPVSHEITVDGVRMQNFEFGLVKIEGEVAVFEKEVIVDDLGTRMPRRVHTLIHWDKWREDGNSGITNNVYKLGWERPRVTRNIRNEVGRMIREGYLRPEDLERQGRNGIVAPTGAIWTTFDTGYIANISAEAPGLGGTAFFIYQTYWYDDAIALYPKLNIALYVDSKPGAGKPIDHFETVYDAAYQKFVECIAVVDNQGDIHQIPYAELDEWLGEAETIEEAIVAKGLAEAEHTVKFVVEKEVEGVLQDVVIKEITVSHGELVPADQLPPESELEIPAGKVFGGWDKQELPVNSANTIYRPVFGEEEVTVTFVDHDGTVLKEETVSYGADVEAPADPVREDYIFTGWDPETLTNIREDTVFVAQYEATVAFVRFIDHDGILIGEEQKVEFGSNAVPPEAPELEHYTFDKWDKDFTNVQGDLVVQAIYIAKEYEIIYHLGDGETNHSDNPATYTVETPQITLKPATKEGMLFEGWFTDEALTEAIEKIVTETGGEVNLYPKFGELPEHESLIGRINPGSEPKWILERYEELEENVRQAYTDNGFEGLADNFIVPVDLGQARVMLYQVFGENEMLVINELDLIPFAIEGKALVDYVLTHTEEIVLGVTVVEDVTYLVTDRAVVYVDGSEVKELEHKLGVGTELQDAIVDITLNDFGKAYKLAGFDLGIPQGIVEVKKYNTYDFDRKNVDYPDIWRCGVYKQDEDGNKVRSEKSYYVQQFTNGYIIMGRQGVDEGDFTMFTFGAAPITNEMYALVIGLEGNEALQETGAPTSVQLVHEGIIYQNFEFGYVKVEDDVATFTVDLVVDDHGTEMHRRVGSGESVKNWLIGDKNANVFFQAYERLRTHQEMRNTMGQTIRGGLTPYEDDDDIHWAAHEMAGYGIVHPFKKGEGTATIWGGTYALLKGPWYLPIYEHAPALNKYIADERQTNGFAVAEWHRLYNVEYQLLENGLAYVADGEDPAFVDNETLAGHLEEHVTIDAWLIAAGIALEPAEEGNPEEGTVKFVSFDVETNTGKFWYEDETHIIDVSNSLLYDAWRETAPNMAQAINNNGAPLYADENNFITDKHWYYIEEGVVKVKDTFGTLPEDVDALKTGDSSVAIDSAKQVVINKEFGNAYILVWDRSGHHLGLPLGPAEIQKEILDPDQPDLYIDVIVQKFEHGWIVQEAYEGTAFAVYGEILELWQKDYETEDGAGGVQELGVPMSRQFKVGDVYYQNFKYGYMKLEDGVASFKFDVGDLRHIDFNGNPVHYRFGRFESRSNAAVGHPDYMYESARFYEAYMKAYSDYSAKRKAENYQFGELLEVKGAHEWNGVGMTQGFTMGSSTANCWGQTQFVVIVQKSPYLPAQVVSSGILMIYSDAAGNQGSFGFPIDADWDMQITETYKDEEITFTVTYQNFANSYIRSYTINDIEVNEYFEGYKITEDGKHINIETGEEEPVPAWKLEVIDQPEVSKEELEEKLAELKDARAEIGVLKGDIKDLPSNKKFAPQEVLDEIDQKIAEIEALLAKDDLSSNEIEEALVEIQLAKVKLNTKAQPGQGAPVEETGSESLSGGAIAGITIAVILVVAAIIGGVVFAVLKKKK